MLALGFWFSFCGDGLRINDILDYMSDRPLIDYIVHNTERAQVKSVFDQSQVQDEERKGVRARVNTNLAYGIIRKFSKELFGDLPAEELSIEAGAEDFKDRDEEFQQEKLFDLFSLVAEQKDLIRSIKEYNGSEEDSATPQFEIKVVAGRRVKVPTSQASKRKNYREGARDAAAVRLVAVKDEIKKLGSIPGLREAYEEKLLTYFFLAKAAASVEEHKNRLAEVDAEIDELRAKALAGKSGVVIGVDRSQIDQLMTERLTLLEQAKALENYDGGHALGRMITLREYGQAFSAGHMVEIPSMKKSVDFCLDQLRNHQPVLLAGHMGSGKTETAKHAARLFMMEQGTGYDPSMTPEEWYNSLEPEFFSGSEEASIYDLVGKLKLVGRTSVDPKDLERRVIELRVAMQASKIDVPDEELAKLILGKADATQTMFSYGPLGRALRDGVPIIIDEINRMRPESVARLNDVVLRGVGAPIKLQENGEESLPMKAGFAVVATCNLGVQYKGLQDVDAAFKSRFVGREVGYPSIEETYDLILAALIRKDRVRLPPDFPAEQFDQLVDLTVAVHEIQEIFSGKTEGQRFMAMVSSVAPEKSQLEQTVVSTRDLMRKIVQVWKAGNFKESLDDIIARNIIASEVFSKDDQKFMAEIFLRRGFFANWKQDKFEAEGIHTISQNELDVLQAQMKTPEYATINTAYDQIRSSASTHASLIRDQLLIGTKKPIK